jgi:type II secretory pathway component PulJ
LRPRLLRDPKKKPLILFEILIALSLTAILLTFLFSFFVESAKIEKKLDTARMAITARNHLQTRLQAILSSITHDSFQSPLYTKQFERESQPSLVAVFDNGIDPDPAYSGPILGRLFLDDDHNLTLATWPADKNKNPPWRKEVLLSNVQSFEFEFLGPTTATEHGKKEAIRPITANLCWRTQWPRSQTEIPSIIRLNIQQQKTPLHFAFLLPAPAKIPSYARKL